MPRHAEAICPLAVLSKSFGKRSETFIHRHMLELLPCKTAVVVHQRERHGDSTAARLPLLVLGESVRDWRWHARRWLYRVKISRLSPVQAEVCRFLTAHGVTTVLSEYLNHSLEWLDVAKKLGLRFFAHAHGHDVSLCLREPKTRRDYLRLAAADGIITMSRTNKRRLAALGLDADRIHVVPYGVDVPDAVPQRRTGAQIRCLAVGRMVAKKAPLLTLEAFRLALSDQDGLKLDYIGEGALLDAARRYVRDHHLDRHVTLHGARPHAEVLGFMSRADIFLQHSRTDPLSGDEEGLPVAILEAMANGLPVVSTRHAGIPEAVLEGTTGCLVDEGDVAAMAVDIRRLADDAGLRQRLGRAAWMRAKQDFSWKREKSALIDLLGLDHDKRIRHETP